MIRNCFIYSALLLVLLACKPEYTKNKTILEAEKVLFNSPDSAYKLLKSINQPEKLPEADYAAWCLHYVHARYKLYLNEQNDSALLDLATLYFEKNGPDKYAGTTLYLKGCFAEDKKNENNAMLYFKQAADKLKNSDFQTTYGLVLHRISFSQLNNEYYSGSIKYIQKAINVFKKTGNLRYLYYCYNTYTEILYRQNYPVSEIMKYANLCEITALKLKDTIVLSDAYFLKGKFYIDNNNKLGCYYISKAYHLNPAKNNKMTVLLGYAFYKINDIDSAKIYIEKYNVDSSNYKSVAVYKMVKAYIAKKENKLDKAFTEFENAYNYREKTIDKINKEFVIKIDKQFDYTQKEQERAKLEIANQQKIILIVILIVLILIGVIIQSQISSRNKLKHKKMELEQQQMQYEIANRKHENAQNLAIIQANIQNKIENTLKFKKLNTGITNKEKVDLFLNEIALQSVVSENELIVYMNEADNLFGKRISALKSKFPQLTSSDLIVISLICLGINHNDCAHLLNISINTLYTRRKRIKTHMGFDKTVDLEEWIAQNIIKLK